MTGEEETMEKAQSLMWRPQTTQDETTISKPTARTKIGAEAETNDATSAKDEHGQEDYKNHQPDSIEQNWEKWWRRQKQQTPSQSKIAKESANAEEQQYCRSKQAFAQKNDNAEETKQTKQIKHANQDLEQGRQKKTPNKSKTSDESTQHGPI